MSAWRSVGQARSLRRAAPGLIALALTFLPAGQASAAQTRVAIDDSAAILQPADTGGQKAAVGLTNLTAHDLTIKPSLSKKVAGCHLSVDKPKLPPAEHTAVTISIPKVCASGKDPVGIKLTALAAGKSATGTAAGGKPIHVTAVAKAPPDWDELRVFVFAFAFAVLAMVVLYVWWFVVDPEGPHTPWDALVSLDKAWTFKDNWVSNITVATGLLTGIFGATDVVKPFLGTKADSSIALATIGSAVAVGLIAFAAVVVTAFKSYKQNSFTVIGLLAAGTLTLTGAFGQSWIAYKTIHQLDLGGAQDLPAKVALVFVVVIILIYSWRSLLDLLVKDTKKAPDIPSESMREAVLIAKALGPQTKAGRQRVDRLVKQAEHPELALAKPEPAEAKKEAKRPAKRRRRALRRAHPVIAPVQAPSYLEPGRSALL